MSENSKKIDLIDALAISGGEPQEVTINGKDLRIRRNFTGMEVKAFMDAHLPENAKDNIRDQLAVVLWHLDANADGRALDASEPVPDATPDSGPVPDATPDSEADPSAEARAAFREEILQRTIPEVTQLVKKLGVIAGLRGRDGNFLTGARF